MVYAASAYQGVELTFNGNNLLKVELIEDDIRKFTLNKPFILNNILDFL